MRLREFIARGVWISILTLVAVCFDLQAAEIDSAMYADPKIEVPAVLKILPPEQIELWLKALNHPEADLQYRVALEICRAHRLGVSDLQKTTDALIALAGAVTEKCPITKSGCGTSSLCYGSIYGTIL